MKNFINLYFLFFLIGLVHPDDDPDDVFLVTNNNFCITNSTSAIVYNSELTEDIATKSSISVNFPTSTTINFDCDFEYSNNCNNMHLWTSESNKWYIQDSLLTLLPEIITDRRWENFITYQTKGILKPQLEYTRVLSPNNNFVKFAVSIRIAREAHIYLCDGDHPTNSGCYWIMLGSNGGRKSVIRKCDAGLISNNPYEFKCKNNLNTIDKNPLDTAHWRNFLIEKINNILTVYREDNSIFIKIEDTSNEIYTTKNVFIHSKGVVGLWKIHYFKFLESRMETEIVSPLGPKFIPPQSELCISLFVKTFWGCNLRLNVNTKGQPYIIEKTLSTNGTWKEYKLCSDQFTTAEYSLYLIKKFDQSLETEKYWAIDDVRIIQKNEYRYISTKDDDAECQLISSNKSILYKEMKKEGVTDVGINCDNNKFGTACIPCSIFSKGTYCPDKMKYCESKLNACYCSAGFKGNACSSECAKGSFGHGCREESHCRAEHSPITGECPTGCEEPYQGTSCTNVTEPFFKSEPTISDIEPTSFKIQQENLDFDGEGDYYYFECRKVDTGILEEWKPVDKVLIPIKESRNVIFNEAEPDTKYEIRAIVSTRKKKSFDSKKFSKYVKQISTTCTEMTENDVNIIPTNTSAKITIKFSPENCPRHKYCYTADGSTCQKLSWNSFNISALKPYRDYKIQFYYDNKEILKGQFKFKTLEGVSSEVLNITDKATEKTIKLQWNPPSERNGEIIGYEISYKFYRKVSCIESSNENAATRTTTNTDIILENLSPYSFYEISVAALTNNYKGKAIPWYIQTLATTELSENEILTINSVDPTKYGFILTFNHILCSLQEGPVQVRAVTNCTSPWCFGLYISNKITQNKTRFFNLEPYTKYNLTVLISRNGKEWKYSDSKNFQTEPDVPGAVTGFTVYSKNDSSISLRWVPPHPPTGILKEYKIVYVDDAWRKNTRSYTFSVSQGKCRLWDDYHCFTISNNIYLRYTYTIEISAQNEDPQGYGSSSTKAVLLNRQAPDPPYGINYRWTENNELFVNWFHPNNTNGLLQSFEYRNISGMKKYLFVRKEENYHLQYEIKVEEVYEACSSFDFFITSHNDYTMSSTESITIKAPPPLPSNISKTISLKSTNVTININIQQVDIVANETFIFISKHDETADLLYFEENLRQNKIRVNNLTTSKIVYKEINLNSSLIFEVGDENFTSASLPNPPLVSDTNYSVCVFLINSCNEMVRWTKFHKYIRTASENGEGMMISNGEERIETEENSELWALLLLLLLPGIIFGIWYMKKKNLNVNDIVKPPLRPQKTDEMLLTEKASISNPRIHIVKPKPTIVLPALQTKHSKKIPIIEFENYVKETIDSGELERQHNLFPKGLLKPHTVGSMQDNKNKNRYKNLIAYDHTRVKLKSHVKGGASGGYINANYIDGYRKPRAYIATQGPKSNTLNDFWNMIWEENIKDIVMLANIHENGKKKVDKYWPDINEEKTFGSVKVQFVSETVFANFTLRSFNVQNKSLVERKVTQMHYTTWPDHGVPLYSQSLVPYLQRLLKIPHNTLTPILVHCSAGVGRTGTIILSDICLRMAAGEGSLDFLAQLENLRNQRANLVDNIEQYKLAHLVVLECLFGMRTSVPCTDEMNSLVDVIINNDGIKTQMKYILETQWQDVAMESLLENDEVVPIYNEKNRVKDILPEKYRVYITRYPHDDESSSYINAIMVDDFGNPGRYIVTQQPLPNTLGDFWRLVLERSCTVIVSLNTINLGDKSVCEFWPEKGEELEPVDFIKISHKKTKRLNFYKVVTVQLSVRQNKLSTQLTDASMEVNIVALDNWRPEELLPNSIEEFLAFRDAADAFSKNSDHVVVTCYDGAKACGLYAALSFIIEQMKLEQECDVCLAVRTIRHSRKQFVTTEEQYEFLYRAAVTFINGFQPYSNFV